MNVREKNIGKKKYNNNGSLMIIVEYRNSNDIDVYFPKYGYTSKSTTSKTFREGYVICPFDKIHYGVAYDGMGKYTQKNDKLAYQKWNGMLNRALSDKTKEKYPTYKDCTICDEWLNFQNFAEWFYNNYYEVEGEQMNLDKDILVKGNKMYSPNTCVFVPKRINVLFVKRDSLRGCYPIGVYFDKSKNKFRTSFSINGNKIKKSFNTVEDTFYYYKKEKEKYIKEVADEYKDRIPQKLYEALYKYEVEITD
ncbi:MAG: AP2 domain-containing protein [Bacilli bacterium]